MLIGPSLSMPLAAAAPVQPKSGPVGLGRAASVPAPEFTQSLVQATPPQGTAAVAAAPAAPSPRQVPPLTLPPEREAPPTHNGPPQWLPADDVPHGRSWPLAASPASADEPGSAGGRRRNVLAPAADSGKPRALPAIKPDPRPLPAELEPPVLLDSTTDPANASGGSLVPLRPFAPPDCFGGPLIPLPIPLQPNGVVADAAGTEADTANAVATALPSVGAATDAQAQTPTTLWVATTGGNSAQPFVRGAPQGAVKAARAAQAALPAQPAQPAQVAQPAQAAQPAQPAQAAQAVNLPATAHTSVPPAAASAAAEAATNLVSTTAPAIATEPVSAGRLTRTEAAVASWYRSTTNTEAAAAVAASGAPAPVLPAVGPNAASVSWAARTEGARQAPGEAAPAAAADRAAATATSDAATPVYREGRTAAKSAIATPTEGFLPNRPQALPAATAAEVAIPAVAPSAPGAAGREAEHRATAAGSDPTSPLPVPGSAGASALGAYQASQAATPAQARLSASPGSPDFAPQLGAQITTFVRGGIEHAQLHLNPAEMGPVSVRIQLDGQTAQVHLSADHALTRQALEASMPQLASQLSEAGLTLGGGGVFEQPRQGREAAAQGGSAEPGRPHRGDDGNSERSRGQTLAAPTQPPMRRGVVDLVA